MNSTPSPLSRADHRRLDSLVDQISLMGGLSPRQLDRVTACFQKVTYDDNRIVFRAGEPASYIYIVLNGRIALEFTGGDHPLAGTEITAGHCFGETSVIGIQHHSATTRAMGPTRLLLLSRADLMTLFNEDKELFSLLILNIARESCRRLNDLNQRLSAEQPVNSRLAS